jgi:DNA-binding transcriptional regulator YiaG
MSKTTTTAKMRADGTVVEVMSDGSERLFPDTPMRPMTEAEIAAAAAADPDERPMTPEELKKARHVPRVKTLRRALGLTQQEFAARYPGIVARLLWNHQADTPETTREKISGRSRVMQRLASGRD